MKSIEIKRVYENKLADGTYRILVDRLWPRGIKKIDLYLDEWDKAIAPTPQLRKWFNHEAEHFNEFEILYRKELVDKKDALNRLRVIAQKNSLTLLYGAKDTKINHAIILKKVLMEPL